MLNFHFFYTELFFVLLLLIILYIAGYFDDLLFINYVSFIYVG